MRDVLIDGALSIALVLLVLAFVLRTFGCVRSVVEHDGKHYVIIDGAWRQVDMVGVLDGIEDGRK